MTDKEFKRLNRAELIEIIYQLQLQLDELNEQKKALERVREMRKNSDKLLEETDTTPYIKPKQFFEESNTQVKPKITNMPPNFPENTSYPDFKEFFKKEEQKEHLQKR